MILRLFPDARWPRGHAECISEQPENEQSGLAFGQVMHEPAAARFGAARDDVISAHAPRSELAPALQDGAAVAVERTDHVPLHLDRLRDARQPARCG